MSGKKTNAFSREHYRLLSSKANGLLIEAETSLGLQHGVWDVLHRIGYRQFFPGETWEVIPKKSTIALSADEENSPDYASRRIWYGYGFWEHNKEVWVDWVKKNRMADGFQLNTGHAYGQLIRSQQATFDAHPEFYALLKGERKISSQSKMCISNPGVKTAAVAYAVEYFERNPEADSVSVDPSDGGNWCECTDCVAIGPPNERALLLANTVAKAVTEKFGTNRFVGMYAYNQHSPPPANQVHPNVVISAATGFIKGGLNIDDIVSGWGDKGATIGIREYYSVNTWDRDLPGSARGSNLGYLTQTIPHFHKRGARFLSAESSDNWGCNGLGYYLATRLFWDVGEAQNRDGIVADFIDKAFGPARAPMTGFYELIDGSNRSSQLVFSDLLARMYRFLDESRKLAAGNPDVVRRIDDLIRYTHYTERFDQYRTASGPDRQAKFEELLRYSYRIRSTFMVHSYAHWRDIANRDSAVSFPKVENSKTPFWRIAEDENAWKSSEGISDTEIRTILENGLKSYKPLQLDFEPKEFTDENLKPALSIFPSLKSEAPGQAGIGRGKRSFYTVIEKAQHSITLSITGGLIAHYRDRGNVTVNVWKLGGESETGERETLIAEDSSVSPDGKERTVELKFETTGTFRIDIDDGRDLTKVTWPEGALISWKMSRDDHPNMMSGRWSLYFYVPKGTQRIGLFVKAGTGAGSRLLNPDGETALDLASKKSKFISVQVPEGMDGKLWKLHHIGGNIQLLNVPPFLARSVAELVLPELKP